MYANCVAAEGEFDDIDDEFGDFYSGMEFVSIATGSKTSLDKAPAIASVITAEDMLVRGVKNLSEALATVPGLNVSHSSQIMAPKFNFRGITSTFSPQTLIMVNGTPIKSIVRGDNHVAWGQFPVKSIARIEVIRGPGSALYGADAFAGVINVITKDAESIKNNQVGASSGSFNSHSAWFNGSLSSEKYDLGFSLEYAESEGFDGQVGVDAQTGLDELANTLFGLPAVSYAPGQVNVGFETLDLFVNASAGDFQMNLGWQERGDLGTGQGVTEALDPNGRVGGRKVIFDLAHETGEMENGWSIKSKLSYYLSSQTIEKDLVLFPPGTFFGAFPDGLIGNPEWKEDNTSFSIKADHSTLDNHFVSIGAGYSYADLYEVTEHKNFFPDITPRPNGLEDVSDTAEVFMPEASRSSRFVYVQDIWQISPDWELTSGLRWDDYSDIGSTLNPRLALVWSTSLQSTTKFLYGRAFRAPSIAELLVVNNPVSLGNPNLSPEVIDTYEVSYSIKSSATTSLNINAFYYEISDFITFTADESASTATAQNVGRREGKGVEVESSYSPMKSIKLRANYSYVKASDKRLNDDVGDYPNHQFNGIFDWDINSHWHLNILANVVGKRLRTPFDTRENLAGYTDLSFNLRYINIENGIEVALRGKNILDDDISEPSLGPSSLGGAINLPHDLPQSGASFYLTVSKDF
jgi:iron complex outermembrane receptor protein